MRSRTLIGLFLCAVLPSATLAADATAYQCVIKALIRLNNGKVPGFIEIPLQGVQNDLTDTLTVKTSTDSPARVVFRRGVRNPLFKQTRKLITATQNELPDVTGNRFLELLPVGEKHNFVILGDRLIIAPTSSEPVEDFLSKHFLLSNDSSDVRFAGTLWRSSDGTLHFDNGSGSYQPGSSVLATVENVLKKNLHLEKVSGHPFTEKIETPVAKIASRDLADPEFQQNVLQGLGKDYVLVARKRDSANWLYWVRRKSDGATAGIIKVYPDFTIGDSLQNMDAQFWRRTVEAGGYLKRGTFAYRLSEKMGLHQVPYTSEVTLPDGRRGVFMGLLQDYTSAKDLIVPDAQRLSSVPRADAQKFLLYDIIVQMQDRHAANWMLSTEGKIGLIDNDRTMLNVRKPSWQNRVDLDRYLPQAKGDLDPTARDFILSFSASDLEKLMQEAGFDGRTQAVALQRLERLKAEVREGRSMEDIYSSFGPNHVHIPIFGLDLYF